MIKSVCVYGGSNSNSSAKYSDEAFRVGVTLAKLGITVYYGGGACGVMGSLADGVSGLSWLNYGKVFGMESPLVLNLGILILTFGLTINITIASIIGVIIAILIYRLL